jgi:hypothetical protein
MKPLSSDMNDNIAVHIKSWTCLAQLGYKFSGVERKVLASDVTCRRFIFVNRPVSRAIEISNYYSSNLGAIFIKNIGKSEEVALSIFRVENWLDYHVADLPEELSKEKYLKIKYLAKDTGVEPVLDFLEKLFWGPLKPILMGETWENVPWDDTYK